MSVVDTPTAAIDRARKLRGLAGVEDSGLPVTVTISAQHPKTLFETGFYEPAMALSCKERAFAGINSKLMGDAKAQIERFSATR